MVAVDAMTPGGMHWAARGLKFLTALPICGVAVLLPYRSRVLYGEALAWLVHAPFIAFGRLARLILTNLERGESAR